MKWEDCKGCGERVEFGVMGEDLLCVHCTAIAECEAEERDRERVE